MADLDRKEFAAICHTTKGVITTNISRGKIILLDNGLIDTKNKINEQFFNRYLKVKNEEKNKQKKEISDNDKLRDKVVKKPIKKKNWIKDIADSLEERKAANGKAEVTVDWDLRKKKAEALLKERSAEKALLSLKKMYGEMVPTEFVTIMFTTFTKSILSVFDNSLMNLAGVYCDELAGGDREALSKVNQKLNEEFQSIISNASEIAKKDMKNEIKQYAIKRGKGEKK